MFENCNGRIIMDDEIPLNYEMPEELKYVCDAMIKAAYDGDLLTWGMYEDNIGSFAKVIHLQGRITKECRDAIYQRFRTGG